MFPSLHLPFVICRTGSLSMERGCDAMDRAPWGRLAVRSPDRSLAIRSWIRTKWLVLDECMKHILCATSEWADAGGRGVGGSGGRGGRGGAWAIDRRATPALCDGDGRLAGARHARERHAGAAAAADGARAHDGLPALLLAGGGVRRRRAARLAFFAAGPAALGAVSGGACVARARDGIRLRRRGDERLPADGGAGLDRARHAGRLAAGGAGRALGRGAGAGRHRAGVRGIVRLEDTGVDVLDAADFVFYEPPAADAAPIDGM